MCWPRDVIFMTQSEVTAREIFPFRVVGEVTIWQGHQPEQIKVMKDGIQKLNEQGVNSLND